MAIERSAMEVKDKMRLKKLLIILTIAFLLYHYFMVLDMAWQRDVARL